MIELRKVPTLRALIQCAVIRAGLEGIANHLHESGMVEIVSGPDSTCSLYYARVRFNLLTESFDVVDFHHKERVINPPMAHRERPVKKVVREPITSQLPDWDDLNYDLPDWDNAE